MHHISVSAIECAQILDRLTQISGNAEFGRLSNLQQADIGDQSARFRLWGGNLGAFQMLPAASSLDHRLRQSPKVAYQIHEILEDLRDTAHLILAIARGERPNRKYLPEETSDHEELKTFNSLLEGDEHLSDHTNHRPQPILESEELIESMKSTISSLFRISIVIRRASPRDRFSKALLATEDPFDDSFDIAHTGHKYPLLERADKTWLKIRLGQAITQRRQFLRYAREHREKLKKETPNILTPDAGQTTLNSPVANVGGGNTAPQVTKTSTKATSKLAPTEASTLLPIDMPIAEAVLEKDFADNKSQMSYAMSMTEIEDECRFQLPQLADVSSGASSFECPLCWQIQNIQKQSLWHKHAFSDLRPYVCTFKECDAKLFSERRDWWQHELYEHRKQWLCPFCRENRFDSVEKFRAHLHRQHTQSLTASQRKSLEEASSYPVESVPAQDCPFCSEWDTALRNANPDIPPDDTVVVTPAQFKQHVGAHMQSLALFSIPRGIFEEGADADSVGSVDVAALEDTSSVKYTSSAFESDTPFSIAEKSDRESGHWSALKGDRNNKEARKTAGERWKFIITKAVADDKARRLVARKHWRRLRLLLCAFFAFRDGTRSLS